MAVVQVSTAPSRALYEQIAKIVDVAGSRPAGLILHAASEMPSGEIQIVDVYESAEALAAFAEKHVIPAFAEAGVLDEVMAQTQPVGYEAFQLIN